MGCGCARFGIGGAGHLEARRGGRFLAHPGTGIIFAVGTFVVLAKRPRIRLLWMIGTSFSRMLRTAGWSRFPGMQSVLLRAHGTWSDSVVDEAQCKEDDRRNWRTRGAWTV